MKGLAFLAVKDFAKFQHYRDRNPPWIKLYGALLTDAVFLQMPEAAQAQLMKLWILASQFGHPLPNNPKLLAGRIGTVGKFYLSTLIDAGFLIPREHSASSALAEDVQECEHNAMASVRVRARGESSELERELSVTPAEADGESGLAALLESDSDRTALTAVLGKARSRAACIAALAAMLSGNDPATPQPTGAQFGHALRDYAANAEGWGAALFRGYLPTLCCATGASSSGRQPPLRSRGWGTDLCQRARCAGGLMVEREMIEREMFARHMAMLGDRIGRPLLGPTLREYHRQLSAVLTTEQFIAAATLAFNTWTGEYRTWPSPQQLIELVAPVAKPGLSALEAFELVLGITNDPRVPIAEQRTRIQTIGATSYRAFHATGGFRDFRNVLESDIPWLRKRFVESYEAACKNADAEQAATLALNDAESRVAGLIAGLVRDKQLPPGRKVG